MKEGLTPHEYNRLLCRVADEHDMAMLADYTDSELTELLNEHTSPDVKHVCRHILLQRGYDVTDYTHRGKMRWAIQKRLFQA